MFFSTKFLSFVVVSLAAVTQGSPAPEVAKATHTGDVTWYTPGLGACGRTNIETDIVAAVAANIYDTYPGHTANPNNNPICGKTTTVTAGGKWVLVTIVDRCPGCGSDGIDLSPAAFKKLADLNVGRIHSATYSI